MTGMKEGTGEDPFADDESEADAGVTPDMSEEPPLDTSAQSADDSDPEMPYVLRRQRVKDERTEQRMAHLREEFAALEDEIFQQVAQEIDVKSNDLSMFDLREAYRELAARHQEELGEILLEWGYEYRQD